MKNRKIIIINILLVIFTITLILSIYKIYIYKSNENYSNEELDTIIDEVTVNDIKDSDNTEIINIDDTPKSNSYFDYINMNLIDVNFDELKSINSNVKGWIKVNGTNINYPFVQGSDNKYYLNHSFDNTYNIFGWVFLDYRNDISNFDDKNTIIYGHSTHNKTMFGSLKDVLTDTWLNDTNNYVIKISTEYENTLWQVFSVYQIKTTSDYLKVDFDNDDNFKEFTDMLTNRSIYNFNAEVLPTDRILTLSSCYNSTNKVVLHAKLIKKETKS